MLKLFVLIVLLSISNASSQTPDPQPTITLPPELSRVLTDYESAWRAKDPAALSLLFVEDGFVMSPGSPAVRGRDAIRKFYTGHGGPLFLRAIAFAQDGAIAYILGGFTSESGRADAGKFTLILKKDRSSRWLILSDMDNGNRSSPNR